MPPRGGRGGGGRRGGPPKPGYTRIAGMEIAYDADVQTDKNARPQPSKTFPDYPGGRPPAPRPATAREQRQLALQQRLRLQIRRSPLYTNFSSDSAVGGVTAYSSRFGPGATTTRLAGQSHGRRIIGGSSGGGSGSGGRQPQISHVDPFNMMPHYSDRYDRKRRRMPRLDQQRVRAVLAFFPEELHSILDASVVSRSANGVLKRGAKRERDSLDANEIEAAEADEAEAANATADEDEDIKDKTRDRRNKRVVEEGEDVESEDEGAAGAGEDAEVDEQDEDDDFEDDEEELAGDYDAEGYFDDGGEDAGDDDVDDGGGGGDYD